MAIIKCKMCGAGINMEPDKTYGVCEYCGCMVTYPKISDEQRIAAYDRGNFFRRKGEFDQALTVYENIVREEPQDAEAHWCCVLCRYGIEYVQDTDGLNWIPTCHRASFDNILEDIDYQYALEYSDGITRKQYQREAMRISEIQKRILRTSQKEEKYDIFICYKEQDEQGERTQDSVLAQNIYDQLQKEGYRTFFARITLEDKAGTEYEPYIFAALHSAKVMLVIGTKPEYLNAVWVKNEWGRYLALMHKDSSKILLPCYQGMSPYDLPEALSVLQSYDMSKIGFMQDLVHGIGKLLRREEKMQETHRQETVVIRESSANVEALLKRGFLALEDQNWEGADGFFEQVLNNDAENSRAYLGKFYASRQAMHLEEIIQRENASRAEYRCTEEKLSMDPEKEAQRMVENSALDLKAEKEWILKRLRNLDVQYSSEQKQAQMDVDTLERLQKEDGNLVKAIRFCNEGDTLQKELAALTEKFQTRWQQETKAAQEAKEAVTKKYTLQYNNIRQEAEYRKICDSCRVPEGLFACSEAVASLAKKEKRQLQAAYEGADIDTLEAVHQKIQDMTLFVFDQEAELNNLEAVIHKNTDLKDLDKENKKTADKEVGVLQKKKEELEQSAKQIQITINQAQNIRREQDPLLERMEELSLLCAIGLWIFAAVCLFYMFSAPSWGLFMLGLVSGMLGFGCRCFSKSMANKREIHVCEDEYEQVRGIREEINNIEQQIDGIKRKRQEDERTYGAELKKLQMPSCRLQLKGNDITKGTSVCCLIFRKIEGTHLYFEVPDITASISTSLNNPKIFCYEKEQFYPVCINNCKREENGYLVDATVTNQGLAVKLENFTDKEHFILLKQEYSISG